MLKHGRWLVPILMATRAAATADVGYPLWISVTLSKCFGERSHLASSPSP